MRYRFGLGTFIYFRFRKRFASDIVDAPSDDPTTVEKSRGIVIFISLFLFQYEYIYYVSLQAVVRPTAMQSINH